MTPAAPAAPSSIVSSAAPPAAPVAPAPEAFTPLTLDQFKLPDGFTLQPDASKSFLDIMNNRALTPAAQAQALLDLQANLTRQSSEAGSRAWEEQQQTWQSQIETDPAIGGPNMEKTIASVARVIDKYAGAADTPFGLEVRQAFDQTGAGNHPAIVKFLNAVGLDISEAPIVPPGGPTNGQAKLSLADRLFSTTN